MLGCLLERKSEERRFQGNLEGELIFTTGVDQGQRASSEEKMLAKLQCCVWGERAREDIEIVIEAGCQKASFPHTLRSKDSGLDLIGINGS